MKIKSWIAGIALLACSSAPALAQQANYASYLQPAPGSSSRGAAVGTQPFPPVAPQSVVQGVPQSAVAQSNLSYFDAPAEAAAEEEGGTGLFSGFGSASDRTESLALKKLLPWEGIDFGGWTQAGYTSQPTLLASLAADPSAGGSFNNIEDTVNLHQQYFFIGKEADGSKGFDWGFRADFIYGIDGPDTQSFGNAPGVFDNGGSFTRGDGAHGWAIPQLYGEFARGDWNVIVGHFYTLVGYEVVPAPDNFFFSHALTQFNAEPFTHTGVLATYSGNENLTWYGGWTLGWDTGFDQVNGGSNFLGGVSAQLTDRASLTYITTIGNFGVRDGGQNDSYAHSLVLDVAVTDRFTYVLQSDLVSIDADSPNGPIEANDQVGLNQYTIFQYNDVLSFGSRAEWFKTDGISHYGYTSGVNVRLLDNLIIRPEYRRDWVPALDFQEDIFGMDMILTY